MDADTESTNVVNPDNKNTKNMNPELNMNTEFPTLSKSQKLNHLKTWLTAYAELVSGVQMLAGTTIECGEGSQGLDEGNHWLDETSQTRVDALLRLRQDAGGQSRVVGGRVEGAPELVVKVFDGVGHGAIYRRKRTHEEKGIVESILVGDEEMMIWDSPGLRAMYPCEEDVFSGTTFPGLGLNFGHFYRDDLSAQLSQLGERVGSVRRQRFEEMRKACE